MVNYNKKMGPTQVRVGEVRFSYLNCFKPRETQQGDAKYSAMLLIPKTDAAAKNLLDEAIREATALGAANKWGGKTPKKLGLPIHDGDDETETAYSDTTKGHWFLNVSSNRRPGVAVLENGVLTEVDALDSEAEDLVYSGCYGCAVVNFAPYAASGNNGVGVYLNNLVKTRDGESLAGSGRSVRDDFGDLAAGIPGLD